MKVKCAILSGIVSLLAAAFLTGCTYSVDKLLTAKEAWDKAVPTDETIIDGIPLYMSGFAPIAKGKPSFWHICVYSESEGAVWYCTYLAHDRGKVLDPEKKKLDGDIASAVYDLSEWKIDSPDACSIAAENGAGKTGFIRLQVSGLEALDINYSIPFDTPEFIPGSTKLFWVIRDENCDMYCIDANTGEYLGVVRNWNPE